MGSFFKHADGAYNNDSTNKVSRVVMTETMMGTKKDRIKKDLKVSHWN